MSLYGFASAMVQLLGRMRVRRRASGRGRRPGRAPGPCAAGAPGACPRFAGVPCDARSTGWRGETRCARLRELRSDNRRENDGRRALRAPPALLRFSAAHKARPRRTGRAPGRAFGPDLTRALAITVAAFARNDLVIALGATDACFAAGGSGSAAGHAPRGALRRAPTGRHGGRQGARGAPSAAPSSAASGSARAARFVLLTCGALFERSSRSERSELRRTTPRRAAQGTPAKRGQAPGAPAAHGPGAR